MPDVAQPAVSVVIPTHNRPQLLARAIRSVLDQTFQDFEIIVVDDGFEKSAEAAVKDFNDPRLRYLKNGTPLGGGATRNRGIDAARADIVAFLDDDDEWLPEKLERQVDLLESAPQSVSLVFSGVRALDPKGRELYRRLPETEGRYRPLTETLNKCFIWTSALAARTQHLRRIGGFDPNLQKNQEWDLELRLLESSDFIAINEPLTIINILSESEHMGGRGNIQNVVFGYRQFLSKHRALYRTHPRAYAKRLFHVSTLYRDLGKHWHATLFRLQAFLHNPTNEIYLRHFVLSLLGPAVYNWVRKTHGTSRENAL